MASGFRTRPIRSHSENVLKFLPFLSIKGQNGSLNVTLSCQSTLYVLSPLPRRIIGQRHQATTDAHLSEVLGEWHPTRIWNAG